MAQKKKFTKLEIISTIVLVGSFLLNVFQGISNINVKNSEQEYRQSSELYKKKIDSLTCLNMQMQIERNKPQIAYNTIYLKGNIIKQLTSDKVSDQLKEMIPNPQFYSSDFLHLIFSKIKETNSELRLKQMIGDFAVIKNNGNSRILNLVLQNDNSKSYDLGVLDPGACKLVAKNFFQKQPWEEKIDSKKFIRYSYRYILGKDTLSITTKIENKNVFWIPYSGEMEGIGMAIMDNKNDIFLK